MLKSRDITLPSQVCIVRAVVFPVVMYGCENWTIKKAEHRRIDAFELWCWRRLLKSPLDCKEIKPVYPKGNQSWIFIGRTNAEAETPILWPLDVKNWLIGKDPDAGKDWRQEEKGPFFFSSSFATEDEMVEWHHWLNGHDFEQGDDESWWWTGKPGMLQFMGLQRDEQLNWTERISLLSRMLKLKGRRGRKSMKWRKCIWLVIRFVCFFL